METPVTVNFSDKSVELVGRSFASGCISEIGKWLIIGGIIILALVMARNFLGIGVDDTDVSVWDRSGLRVYTDAKTGVQYLSDGHGGMVVRQGVEK